MTEKFVTENFVTEKLAQFEGFGKDGSVARNNDDRLHEDRPPHWGSD